MALLTGAGLRQLQLALAGLARPGITALFVFAGAG